MQLGGIGMIEFWAELEQAIAGLKPAGVSHGCPAA
jgi:hypothetical protein